MPAYDSLSTANCIMAGYECPWSPTPRPAGSTGRLRATLTRQSRTSRSSQDRPREQMTLDQPHLLTHPLPNPPRWACLQRERLDCRSGGARSPSPPRPKATNFYESPLLTKHRDYAQNPSSRVNERYGLFSAIESQ